MKLTNSPTYFEVLREALKHKSLGRICVNAAMKGAPLKGRVLDLGAGNAKKPSYWRYVDTSAMVVRICVDIVPKHQPDIIADVCERLPFEDVSFDTAMCFNLLEHVAKPERALAELFRVMKSGATLYGCAPFMVGVHGDPSDYRRFTGQALGEMFRDAGFREIRIEPIGGPFAAAYMQVDPLTPKFLHALIVPIAWCLDRALLAIAPARARNNPTDYAFICLK